MPSESPQGDPAGRRLALLRIGGFALLVAVGFAVVWFTGSFPDVEGVRARGEDLGAWAKFAFIPAFVLLNFVITWPILAGAGGLLFGTAAGHAARARGRRGRRAGPDGGRPLSGGGPGRQAAAARASQWVEGFLQEKGWIAVMETRIVPVLPYGIVNYAAGLTSLRFRDMALGTVVGAAPKVFAYVALGGSLTNLGAPEAKVAIALLVVAGGRRRSWCSPARMVAGRLGSGA